MALQLIRNPLTKLVPLSRNSHHAAQKLSHALNASAQADLTALDNGIQVITEKTNTPSATVGVWISNGSRHEPKELNGITNFIEQVLFKGSKNRSRKQLEKEVYGLGAVFNSFNNRENSGYFATLAPSDVSKAVEILGDLIRNPALSQEDIEESRRNILKELEQLETNHEQVVMDYLHSVAYQGNSLEYSKYGPTENIKKFTRDDLERAWDLIFKGPCLVVAASGNVDHGKIVQQVEKAFKGISTTYEKNDIPSISSSRYTGSDIRVRDDSMSAAHVAFAVEGPGYNDPDSVVMEIASSLLGQWDLTHGGGINVSSYMGMISAAEHLAQSYQSFNLTYRDTALWGGYFVGERMRLEEMLWQLQYQWKRLCVEVANNEIRQGKNALLTKLISQREGSVNNANSLALDVLRHGRRISLEEWHSRINAVNSQKIRAVAENYIWDRCPVVSAIGPVEGLPHYEEIRMRMSWMRY